jgi:hypothetical protein
MCWNLVLPRTSNLAAALMRPQMSQRGSCSKLASRLSSTVTKVQGGDLLMLRPWVSVGLLRTYPKSLTLQSKVVEQGVSSMVEARGQALLELPAGLCLF